MDEAAPAPELAEETAPVRRRRPWWRSVLTWAFRLAIALVLAVVVLDSPIGHRIIADQIDNFAPASGLRIHVGRIGGSLFGETRLRKVTLFDDQGIFLEVPEVVLDWRPQHWFSSGLDIRRLTLRRGTLVRLPRLKSGDPDAPILPAFDIRIDALEIEGLKVAAGVLGTERRVDLTARADIRKGRALIRADGKLGGKDRLFALLDAEPDRDTFDLRLDYAAPKGGLLAGLAGAKSGLELIVAGKGGWRHWDGALLAKEDARQLAALRLGNRAGRYTALGQVWPGDLLGGLTARAAGSVVSLDAAATLADGVLDGHLGLTSAALRFNAAGKADLAHNAFDAMRLRAALTDPALAGGDVRIDGARLTATLDGPFRDLEIEHSLVVERLAFGTVRLEQLATSGTARFDGTRWTLPLDLRAARIVTGQAAVDPRLVQATARGLLTLTGKALTSEDLALDVPGLSARLHLRGDLGRSVYGLAGVAAARGWPLPDIGLGNADAKLVLSFGRNAPWRLRTNFAGRLARVDNATLTTLAGDNIRFSGGLGIGAGLPLVIDRAQLLASKLTLALAGRRLADGRAVLAGSGRHTSYGPFRLDAQIGADGPHAALVFADPWPPGGLKDVRVALAPITDGFRIDTEGGSALGPFTGTLGLFARKGSATRIEVEQLAVWKTSVTGSLLLGGGAATGTLRFAGGGVDGTAQLAPRGGGQGIELALAAENASFAGATPIIIGSGELAANGFIAHDRSTVAGNVFGQGISIGSAFIGRVAAKGQLTDGRGQVTASIAGRRGSRFDLQVQGDVAPGRIALLGQGSLAGRRITMPRRAVLTREADGWRLARSQVSFGGGRAIASGLFGGEATELQFAVTDMPLSLADIALGDMGLGGSASGLVDYRKPRGGAPSGSARLQVQGLTRSGLVLTSRPLDLALVATLSAQALETRAVLRDGTAASGRMQARITALPAAGTLGERLRAGSLFGQLRYAGPADALWRLVALEEFDLTGPVAIAADATGTISDPRITGSLASDALRLRSALTGTDISAIAARGRFSGSRLEVASFTGRAGKDGRVTGSGSFDLSGLGSRGPGIDLRIAAQGAPMLAKTEMAATVTGPVRIVSDGINGTIAGRLRLETARWQLGRAAAQEELPDIRTREINRRADIAPPRVARTTWHYLIDAAGDDRITVRGLGLDSEWGADIHLRGTTRAPAIEGKATLVRGGYEFAGKRFELTRGRIAFAGESPPDPRLDIVAEAAESGVNARVSVTGTSLHPEIRFSSVPALPEEELLSRLLFGTSITEVSAPEALQLGAALAALRGGSGLDPINKLRRAIGLDRLRIVSADAASGRGTGIAAGKYLGRRFYAEIITDGRGYSATELEFRVTGWLSLLASVSSIGRESINLKASKDY